MDEEKDLIPERYYTVGDEIRVRVTFVHQANIEEVRLVFSKEKEPGIPEGTLTFIGEVEDTQELDIAKHGLSRRQSSALLRSLVDVDHAPGLYILWWLSVRTASGETIRLYSSAFSLAFQIVDESGRLEGVKVEFEDPQEDSF